jgi:hypothetical protein
LVSKLVIQWRGSVRTMLAASMPTTSPGPYISTLRGTCSLVVPPPTLSALMVSVTPMVARIPGTAAWSASCTWPPSPWRAHGRKV